ncbi:MAG: hypothetical protein ACFFCQ_14955 [Promethearchaeota archaeon]
MLEHVHPNYRKYIWMIEDMLNTSGFNDPTEVARLLANHYSELYEKLLQLALAFFQQEQRNLKGKFYEPQNIATAILSNKILIFLEMLGVFKRLPTPKQNEITEEYEGKEPNNFIELLKTQDIYDIRTIGAIFGLYSHSTVQAQFVKFVLAFMEQLSKNFENNRLYNINETIAPMASQITTFLRTKENTMPLVLA